MISPQLTIMADLAVRLLRKREETCAVAESITGGMLGAALTEIAGASSVFRGGVIAYASDLKAALLDVDPDLLRQCGTVHPDVAVAMAHGARRRLAADFSVATTGVAGPQSQDEQEPGTVFIACVGPAAERVVRWDFDGDRAQVRRLTVINALRMLIDELSPEAQ